MPELYHRRTVTVQLCTVRWRLLQQGIYIPACSNSKGLDLRHACSVQHHYKRPAYVSYIDCRCQEPPYEQAPPGAAPSAALFDGRQL